MKNKLLFTFIIFIVSTFAANADFMHGEASDYTGEAFFAPPAGQEQTSSSGNSENKMSASIPPVKLLRLKIKEALYNRKQAQKAPVSQDVYAGDIETSEYASKEPEEHFDNDVVPDGFEADNEALAEAENRKKGFFKKKNKKVTAPKNTEDIILDCDNVDYDTPNYLIHANGNVVVTFVKQGTVVKSDIMTFDRISNTLKAEGNVQIIKGSQVITGDYIFVDMNEENGLIENPVTNTNNIEIRSKKGYVYGDRTVQEDGTIKINKTFPLVFKNMGSGPQMSTMLVPQKDSLTTAMNAGEVKIQTDRIKITQNGDHETIAFKKFRMHRGKYTVLKIPAVKLYTNKNHEYIESNLWEIGSVRGMGVYTGPGWVFELPKGSVLKAMPILSYKNKFGIGAIGRFQSGTNRTQVGYSTAVNKIIAYGRQKLDDDLYLQYGLNDYMDEWFLGRRRPKYGVDLYYKKDYSSDNFLLKGHASSYSHRVDVGFYNDLDYDDGFEKIKGNNTATARFRYMAMANQNLFNYSNPDKLTAFGFDIASQLSATVYGTGDTQVIGRLGPVLHTQYKRWMQDVGYYISVADDKTPMPVFDAYRYGTHNVYLREYFRICRFLTLSWFGSANITRDNPSGQFLNENCFYVSVGPDDLKLSVGYDVVRQALNCAIDVALDAKGTTVDYKTFEIKQDKKAKEEKKYKDPETAYESPSGQSQKVLQKAVVENVKMMEDVL